MADEDRYSGFDEPAAEKEFDDSAYLPALEKAATDEQYKSALTSFLRAFLRDTLPLPDEYSEEQKEEDIKELINGALSRSNESFTLRGPIGLFQLFFSGFGRYPKVEEVFPRRDGPMLLLK